jgi:hypothetical protein
MAAAAAVLLLSGCTIGRSVTNFALSRAPAGAHVGVRLTTERIVSGELLAVEDSALVVLADSTARITRIGMAQVGEADLAEVGPIVWHGRFLSPARLTFARNVSRYPQGVSPALLEELLQAYHQTTIAALIP